ncbi:glyoxalase [Pseudooceanicola sediminis]|uniref:Glyoxalase n=1 Tax=Pseudooceanicola sediminis TaxID=2211117 RepID=A0A399IZ94_9RHOB|nr:glyoxalase [Pseudooceanicola sediminis]KAA2313650.1 glyoxalase [Puniceibacterium sp. HSS470]RII38508.1 glyoxalase [Pseudooceanicola sediminis]|tara:strand:+ start:44214 stop:44567 length:354 start_codon:yes stop_codon:yes gene_type:complete
MAVLRITANLGTADPTALSAFYAGLFGMDVAMDLGFIVTLQANARQSPQLSFASQGGSGTPVPDLSIEVDALDPVLERARAGELPLEYGPVEEPWGVVRMMLRDPEGRLVNVLTHKR